MKYRIPYSSHSAGGSNQMVETIEAATDQEAIEKFKRFKSEKENDNGKYYTSYLVNGGLIRVDQEEITTRIL